MGQPTDNSPEPRCSVPQEREKAPVFASWGRWYALVLLHLAFLIAVFYLFTKAFE